MEKPTFLNFEIAYASGTRDAYKLHVWLAAEEKWQAVEARDDQVSWVLLISIRRTSS